ncbi:MAG TPA: aminoacyl-tRNA hydrolase [Bacteroidota bacterium]|nr:aminoacyl-tRNA hydrolase [Bacteroidota bacterium]
MVAIIGLGNPGRRYAETRHNVGYFVADVLAAKLKCRFTPGKGEYVTGVCSLRDNEVLIVKPVTYMNDSGIAVAEIVQAHGVALDQLLVVVDDFQIPLGSLRMRASGSDGGHNGLASIIYHLQSDAFPRLRCGIGSEAMPQDKTLMADFVLSEFEGSEKPVVEEMVHRAVDACTSFVADGIEKTMSVFNRKGEEAGDER